MLFRALTAAVILLAGVEAALQAGGVLAGRRVTALSDPEAPVILCLGDSHTYGAGVEEQEAYPARLEALLRERGLSVNVVNMGAPGTNTSEIRRSLPGLLERYSPVVVIVLAGINNGWNVKDAAWSDLEDGLDVSMSVRAWDFLATRVKLIKAARVTLHRLDWTRPPEETARDRKGAPVIHHKNDGEREDPEVAFDRARRDLVAIIATARSKGAAPVLMTYVTDPEFTFETPNLFLKKTAAKMKAPLADNDKALRSLLLDHDGALNPAARQNLFFPDMHPKPQGYERIAENVARTLDQAGIYNLLDTIKGSSLLGDYEVYSVVLKAFNADGRINPPITGDDRSPVQIRFVIRKQTDMFTVEKIVKLKDKLFREMPELERNTYDNFVESNRVARDLV